jgi:hypothetical protein
MVGLAVVVVRRCSDWISPWWKNAGLVIVSSTEQVLKIADTGKIHSNDRINFIASQRLLPEGATCAPDAYAGLGRHRQPGRALSS